jgi:hypothetical protein
LNLNLKIMTDELILSELTPKVIKSSFLLDQDVILNINNLILESSINPPANHLKSCSDNTSLLNPEKFQSGGLFDSIIDFDATERPDLSIEARNERLNKYLMMLKTERSKIIDLLKICDNERVLFRKMNLELIKSIVEQRSDLICVG